MEVRTLGGEPGRGQDVTIILVPTGGSMTDQKLALIHLHSHVLSLHSKYFNTCLSERWENQASASASMEFLLEAHTDLQHYFDCFSNMYSPFRKSFGNVNHAVELLKVASQIDFQGLMERISLYLSSVLWTKEDEIRVREYSASPDFPRIHLKDLVGRLGLDETQEDREKQLEVLFNCVLGATRIPSVLPLPAFIEVTGYAPPEYSRNVVAFLNQAAEKLYSDIVSDCKKLSQGAADSYFRYYEIAEVFDKIQGMRFILEALLKGQVAEELVQFIVHLGRIPKILINVADSSKLESIKREFAELVLVMYREVVAGRLVLKPPERMALLANWHELLRYSLKAGSFEQATADLFLTLPMKEQAKLIDLQKASVLDFISPSSLASVLHLH